MKQSKIAHDVIIGIIPARPTKRITKDLGNAFRVASGSDGWRILSPCSDYRQG